MHIKVHTLLLQYYPNYQEKMESTSGPPSMRSNGNFPFYGYILVLGIVLGIIFAVPFHSALKKWFREKFGKWFSRISSFLRICVCGSGEDYERDDDDQEQIELNDLVNELDFPPPENRDNLRPHRERQQLSFELRDLQNNLIEYRPDDDHLRDPRLPELPIRMRELQNNPINRQLQNDLINRELQNNLINLHPGGERGGEHRVNGPPEILIEMQNLGKNLNNRPNEDVRRYQEHSF